MAQSSEVPRFITIDLTIEVDDIMKTYYFFIPFFILTMTSINSAFASYITLPASTAAIDESYNDCTINSDGSITSGGSACRFYIPIPVETGETLSSDSAYYYDNSGSQNFQISLKRTTLSSDSYSTLTNTTDYTTSASIQSSTLSYGSSISSSYSYFIDIYLSYGTECRGVKIYY